VAPSVSGSTTITVAPDPWSFAYDGAVTAIGVALTVLEPNGGNHDIGMIQRLATQLLPECAGIRAAMVRGDLAAASWQLLSVARRAAEIILEHSSDWGIQAAPTDLLNMMGPLEIKLGLAAARAVSVLANLDFCLLSSCSTTIVASYTGGRPEVSQPTKVPTPASTPEATAIPIPPMQVAECSEVHTSSNVIASVGSSEWVVSAGREYWVRMVWGFPSETEAKNAQPYITFTSMTMNGSPLSMDGRPVVEYQPGNGWWEVNAYYCTGVLAPGKYTIVGSAYYSAAHSSYVDHCVVTAEDVPLGATTGYSESASKFRQRQA